MKTPSFGFLGMMLGVALISNSALAQSDSGYSASAPAGTFGFISQKAQIKKASRWSLDEWLATKERMGWSNLWLSFNSPTPYEFFLKGTYAPSPEAWGYGIGAYAQGVGLEFDQETILHSAWNARFHLRIFGLNVQNSNITLYGGVRNRTDAGAFRQGYWGASLTFYLRKFFGVFAQYRNFPGSTPNSAGKFKGSLWEVGPFIDFGPLRLFGNYVNESEDHESGGITVASSGNLWNFGAQLFF